MNWSRLSLAGLVAFGLLLSYKSAGGGEMPIKSADAAPSRALPVEELAATFERARESVTRLATADQRGKGVRTDASAAGKEEWSPGFQRNELSVAIVFQSAPLAAKVEKLARNKFLNPRDAVLSEDQLSALQAITETYRDQLQRVEAEKGNLRHAEMMQRMSRGELASVDRLAESVDSETMAAIEVRVAEMPDTEDRLRLRRFLLKEHLMRKLGSDAAVTTPAGEVFLAGRGSMRNILGTYEDYSEFLRDDFFGSVVSFFVVNGLLDDVGSMTLLQTYFNRGR